MKSIKTIVHDIRKELEGAEHYAKLAVQRKDENRQLADSYSKIAQSELNHIDVFHSQAIRMIQEQLPAIEVRAGGLKMCREILPHSTAGGTHLLLRHWSGS